MRKTKLAKTLTTTLAGALLLGSLGVPSTAFATSVDDLRAQGEEAYQNEEYEKAKEIFEELIVSGTDTYYENWYLGNISRQMDYDFTATDYYEKAWEQLAYEDVDGTGMVENWMNSMYEQEMYWYVEQIYQDAQSRGEVSLVIQFNYARALKDAGCYNEALTAFEDATAYLSGDNNLSNLGTIEMHMGDCLCALGRYEEAKMYYQSGYEKCQKGDFYIDCMKNFYLDRNQMSVQEFLDAYLQEKTTLEKAEFLDANGYYKEAITYYEQAQAEGTEDQRYNIAWAQVYAGYPEKGAEILEELLAEDPENITYLNALGGIYCDKLGRYDDADAMFDRALAINPELNGVEGNKAVVAAKRGDFEMEEQIRANLLERYPTYGSMIDRYLGTLSDLDYETAVSVYSNYVDWTDDPELQAVQMAEALSTSWMSEESVESFLEYFQMSDPDQTNYYICRAQAYLLQELGRYDEALAMWDICDGLTYSIMKLDAANGRAYCYKAMGDTKKAVDSYTDSFQHVKTASEVTFFFDLYMEAGDTDQAKAELDSFVTEGGKLEDIVSLYMIWAGYVEDHEALLTYADVVLEESPSSVKAKAYKAAALRGLGREDEANEIIADIDSISYSCSDTNKMIADSILGRTDEAKATYEVLLEQFPGTARAEKNDYELRNLFTDAEFCEMAGRKPIENMNSADWVMPIAIGGGVLAVAGGALLAVSAKRKKDAH